MQVVIEVVDRKARPEVPPLHKLPGGELCLHDEYIELMEDCWAQDPLARPSFEAVIGRLRWKPPPPPLLNAMQELFLHNIWS